MEKFVGTKRLKIVEALVDAFVSTRDGDGSSQWQSIEGPPGIGKTRILQEFYSQLSTQHQGDPKYWPVHLVDPEVEDRNFERERKRIHPEIIVKPANAVPRWLWWGLVASKRYGIRDNSLADSIGQLEVHGPHLQDAARKQTRLRNRVTGRKSRGVARDIAVNTGLELAQVATGSGIPVVSIATIITKYSKHAIQRSRERRTRRGAMILESAPDQGGALDDAVALVRGLGSAGIPTILAIEDLHFADSVYEQLIEKILTDRVTRALIVSTAWSGYIDEACERFGCSVDSLEGRMGRVIYNKHANFQPLTGTECAQLLNQWAPDLSTGVNRILSEHINNPFTIRKLSGMRGALARLESAEEPGVIVSSIPETLADLYALAWRELGPSLQLSLALAALSTPESIDRTFEDEDRWDVEVADRVILSAAQYVDPNFIDVSLASPDDAIPYGWVEETLNGLRRFLDADQRLIASRHANDYLTDEERQQFQSAVADASTQTLPLEVRSERDFVQISLHLAAVFAGIIQPGEPTITAGAALIRFSFGLRGEDPGILSALRSVVALAEQQDLHKSADILELRIIELMCEMDRGRSRMIRDQLRSLETDVEALDDGEKALKWAVRRLALRELRSRGLVQEASTGFERLSMEIRSSGDSRPDQVFEVSSDLAYTLGRLGQPSRAAAVMEELLSNEAPEGMRSRTIMRCRHDLASVLRRNGSLERAADLLEDVRGAQQSYLGSLDPDTLHSVQLLGAIRRDAGQLGIAEQLFEELYACRRSLFGMDHQHTLIAFGHRVWLLRRQLKLDRALDLAEESHDRRKQLLGDQHPVVYDSGRVLTAIYRLSRRYSEALEIIEPVLRQIKDHLGDDEPVRLQTELSHARVLVDMGDHDEARKRLISIRSRQFALLEPDHLDLLSLDYYLLDCQLRMGSVDHPISEVKSLLDRLLAKTYLAHPEVLRLRLLLAKVFHEARNVEASETELHGTEAAARGVIHPSHEFWHNAKEFRNTLGLPNL